MLPKSFENPSLALPGSAVASASAADPRESRRQVDRLAIVGRLTSGLAHELGTPLNIVAGRAKMIADGEVEGAEAVAAARVIAEQAQRMAGVLRQVLGFARQAPGEWRSEDLSQLLEEVVSLLGPTAKSRGVALELDAPRGLSVFCDHALLGHALVGIALNGVLALPRGGKVTLGLESTPDGVDIRIWDQGNAAFAEVMARISRDQEPEDSDDASGVVIRGAIASHRGRLWCERGRLGSSCVVSLPPGTAS